MIEISKIRFQYPKSDFKLQIDRLKIDRGGKTAIIGPSGFGKTTLQNLLAGILVGYFPIQKLAKILPSKSSVVISPVISPRW